MLSTYVCPQCYQYYAYVHDIVLYNIISNIIVCYSNTSVFKTLSFCCSEFVALDPTLLEEAVMDGRLVVGMNIHREICALRLSGGVVILPEQVNMSAWLHTV